MAEHEKEILKYCYWLDDQFLAMLKKQKATVKNLTLPLS